MVDLRKLAFALADSAGRPRLLGAPCLRAVHWVGTSILMSTRCGELLHLDYARSSEMQDVTLLLNGHCHTDRMPSPLRYSRRGADPGGACPSGSHGALACHRACHSSPPLPPISPYVFGIYSNGRWKGAHAPCRSMRPRIRSPPTPSFARWVTRAFWCSMRRASMTSSPYLSESVRAVRVPSLCTRRGIARSRHRPWRN